MWVKDNPKSIVSLVITCWELHQRSVDGIPSHGNILFTEKLANLKSYVPQAEMMPHGGVRLEDATSSLEMSLRVGPLAHLRQ